MADTVAPDVPLEESGKTLAEHLAGLRRRKVQIVAVAAAIAVLSVILAIVLPPVFRSTATILVQEQEIPPDLVRSTITSYADERIQVISQQIMTRAVLLELVDRFDLYRKYRGRSTSDEIVERMRRDIRLAPVDASISDRNSGRRVNSTIAFSISYDAPEPQPAREVANALVNLYLDENVKARQQSVAETNAFLSQEAARVAGQLRDMENRLAEFKRRNAGAMPDSTGVNMQLAERTSADVQRIERDISLLEDRRLALEAQLALVSPRLPVAGADPAQKATTPEERLAALKAQYAASSAIYSADHPDLKRMRREIAALEAQVGDAGAPSAGAAGASELADLQARRAALAGLYGAEHPDIQRLDRNIAALKAAAPAKAAAPGTSAAAPTGISSAAAGASSTARARAPDNPAYVTLATQIETTRREIASLAVARNELRARQRTYDARLLQVPEVEREYRDLTRDYDSAQARYREIRDKQMQAAVAQQLERDRKAERFSVGEPANLPQTPISPNRLRIILMGIGGGLAMGLGLAFVLEAADGSVKGPLDLARIAPVPILTAIPYIETAREHAALARRHWVTACATVLAAAAFLAVIHLYLRPLPTLLAAVRRLTPW